MTVPLGGVPVASVRYLVDRAVPARFAAPLPLGTLTVNIVGSALLGGLIGAGAGNGLLAAAGTGFCGALTTFSYATIRLVTDGAYAYAVGNVVLSVAAGLIAVFVAASTTQWLWT
nr:CrcB family protein [Nocardia tenerifensis]